MGSEILRKLLAEAQALSGQLEEGFDFSDENLAEDVTIHVERAVFELQTAAWYITRDAEMSKQFPFVVYLAGQGTPLPWAAFSDRAQAWKAVCSKIKNDGGEPYCYDAKGQLAIWQNAVKFHIHKEG